MPHSFSFHQLCATFFCHFIIDIEAFTSGENCGRGEHDCDIAGTI